MSFSKAKLKRFNDVDIGCASPATIALKSAESSLAGCSGTPTNSTSTSAATISHAHPERKEQIEKFFKEAVRFATSGREAKEFAIPKEGGITVKEDKKSKGLRLFRTPSLPHRLRFRQHTTEATASSTSSSTPLNSATTTPSKEPATSKSASRLKGKEALQYEIRGKNELIAGYLSQIDALQRHVQQLKASEQQLRQENENATLKTDELVHALSAENAAHKALNEQISAEQATLKGKFTQLELELQQVTQQHTDELAALQALNEESKAHNGRLETELQQQTVEQAKLEMQLTKKREQLAKAEEAAQLCEAEMAQLQQGNAILSTDVQRLQRQLEQDALAYAQETKITQNEMECLKNERNTLKSDLASKCELIRAQQDELLDKTCEIDAHCDTIRQLCREQANWAEQQRLREANTLQAKQQAQQLETELETAVEREKAYWRSELEKRQQRAENELIKNELEKQDVMVLLESTNDMLRERDEKLQRCEEQLRNGVDYYVQLTDTLQKQVVDLKQEVAKLITEKYNYQLTLANTRATVNILMDRLKKSDGDVEQYKCELESVQLAKGALEQSYIALQSEMETLRGKLATSEEALQALHNSSQTLHDEVALKEHMLDELLSNEADTLQKFNKIAYSFQQRSDNEAHYLELYGELKHKDEKREIYMQELKRALDEFANVLQFAQLELDSKDQKLALLRTESDQLKLENLTLKSQLEETAQLSAATAAATAKKENITDLEKIEDLLIDSELRAECDKITSWLLSTSGSSEKCMRSESALEIGELLKGPTTPNNNQKMRTPMRSATLPALIGTSGATTAATTPHTPRTPRTPRTPKTPRTTPKKTVLFVGKENIAPSPQKAVLKARNV